jgi:hypothetical protein
MLKIMAVPVGVDESLGNIVRELAFRLLVPQDSGGCLGEYMGYGFSFSPTPGHA